MGSNERQKDSERLNMITLQCIHTCNTKMIFDRGVNANVIDLRLFKRIYDKQHCNQTMIGPFRSNNEEHKWRSTLQSLLLRFSSPSGKIYVKGVWFVVTKAHYFHDIIGQLERWISCKYNRITSISYLRSIIHLEFLKNCLKIFFGAFQLMTADLCFTFTTSVHTSTIFSHVVFCWQARSY